VKGQRLKAHRPVPDLAHDWEMSRTHLTPATSTIESDWVRSGMVGFAESVVSIVPSGFAVYARIFHPSFTETGVPIHWAQVAERTGHIYHPAVQWPSLVGSTDYNFDLGGMWQYPPEMGSLPRSIALPLVEILREQTSTPDQCWFGVWEGFGAIATSVQLAPKFELPNRRYHLMSGPVDGLLDNVEELPFTQSANLSWPNDRAWLVATEIDFVSTYIGASRSCIEAILGCTDIEAAEVEPSDGVTWGADLLNPAPTTP
jgi:hypothetical protein